MPLSPKPPPQPPPDLRAKRKPPPLCARLPQALVEVGYPAGAAGPASRRRRPPPYGT